MGVLHFVEPRDRGAVLSAGAVHRGGDLLGAANGNAPRDLGGADRRDGDVGGAGAAGRTRANAAARPAATRLVAGKRDRVFSGGDSGGRHLDDARSAQRNPRFPLCMGHRMVRGTAQRDRVVSRA